MINQCNQLALSAASDERIRESFIKEQEQTILKMAYSACRHYVSKSDDEWSIALCAFSKTIDLYQEERGDFLPFAQLVIRRDLIDYFRSKKNTFREVSVAPHVLEGNGEPGEDTEGVWHSVVKTSREQASNDLQYEITAANEMLERYGFRFFDLTECSPKQEKTKKECAEVIRYMLCHPEFLNDLEQTGKLPIKKLAAGCGVSRKTLDRYRKYIIMAVLILEGDYPHIAEYLRFVKERDV